MSSRWFRFYEEAMDDPKVLKLTDREFRLWLKLLCLASRNDGIIPPLDELKLVMKARCDHLENGLIRLAAVGLIDRLTAVQRPLNGGTTTVEAPLNTTLNGGFKPHGWEKRQYKSDTSTERVHKHRAARNVSETPPDTDTETEKKESKKETTSSFLTPGHYAFEANTIKLTPKHLEDWRRANPHISLESELWALDGWAGDEAGKGKNWFNAVSNALAKKERQAMSRLQARQIELSTPGRVHVDGRI